MQHRHKIVCSGVGGIPKINSMLLKKWSREKDEPPTSDPETGALPIVFSGNVPIFLLTENGPSEIGIRTEITSNSDR